MRICHFNEKEGKKSLIGVYINLFLLFSSLYIKKDGFKKLKILSKLKKIKETIDSQSLFLIKYKFEYLQNYKILFRWENSIYQYINL